MNRIYSFILAYGLRGKHYFELPAQSRQEAECMAYREAKAWMADNFVQPSMLTAFDLRGTRPA